MRDPWPLANCASISRFEAASVRSVISRFLSEDPIGYAGGINLYTYVIDDPVALKDPTGLAYDYCTNTNGPGGYNKEEGDIIAIYYQMTPAGRLRIEVRPVIRRECFYRCYCNRPNVCYIRPHPGHRADHGVSEREVPFSGSRTTPAPLCTDAAVMAKVKARGVCP
jgi:hypothetical protein